MRKALSSILLGLVITLAGLFVNYLYFQKEGHLLLGWKMWGGEITSETGFGLRMVRIYAMMQGESDRISLRFEPISFVSSVILFSLLVYLLYGMFAKVKGRGS